MPQGDPKAGELYLHFKKKLYQVITTAVHSETGEQLVIYQALYGDYGVYARPLASFVSQVDRQKYPKVCQRFRFQLIEREEAAREEQATAPEAAAGLEVSVNQEDEPLHIRESVNQEKEQQQESPTREPERPEEKMMRFFDAETMEEKYKILCSMEDCITDHMINNMAVTLDVVIEEGEVEQRFEELKQCVRTFQRYENTRLR